VSSWHLSDLKIYGVVLICMSSSMNLTPRLAKLVAITQTLSNRVVVRRTILVPLDVL